MAELTETRETVRETYAAAARANSGCGPGCGGETVFGGRLYDEATAADAPEEAVSASLGCGVPSCVRFGDRGMSTSSADYFECRHRSSTCPGSRSGRSRS